MRKANVSGRVEPWNYPKPVSSYIYRNDSKNGNVKFTDVTASVAPSLNKVGLVCDALWTDFNNDGWQDLILAGEWMPVKFFKNNNGVFEDVSSASGIADKSGWWNSIVAGDFDNDGDIDYVIGNLGENTFYKGSKQFPVSIYAKDFDKNGITECIPTKYIKDSTGILKEFTAHTRDDIVDQMPFIRKRFLTYKAFAEVSFDKLFSAEEIKDALKLQANYFESAFLRNRGDGTFEISALPGVVQYSCLNGMIADDFDADGNLDILMVGNDYGTEVSTGRYDGCNGLFLKGNGEGGFAPLSILQSGFFMPGNAKALVELRNSAGKTLIAGSQNRGPLKVFELKGDYKTIALEPSDVSVIITYKNGKKQKREVNYGASFLSQSSRFLNVANNAISAQVKDNKGKVRSLL